MRSPRSGPVNSCVFGVCFFVLDIFNAFDTYIAISEETVYARRFFEHYFWEVGVSIGAFFDTSSPQVSSTIRLRRRESATPQDLVLHGADLELVHVFVNGKELVEDAGDGYLFEDEGGLRISRSVLPLEPDVLFEVRLKVTVHPKRNHELQGLYFSEGVLVTQCEPEGFRRITYFLDRPDVLTRYRVRLRKRAKQS